MRSPTKRGSTQQRRRGRRSKKKTRIKGKVKPVAVRIDIPDIGTRILALPIPPKNYIDLQAGKSGVLFISEGPMVMTEENAQDLQQTLHKFDLEKRKVDKFAEEINDFVVSFNGEKILCRKAKSGAWRAPTSRRNATARRGRASGR